MNKRNVNIPPFLRPPILFERKGQRYPLSFSCTISISCQTARF